MIRLRSNSVKGSSSFFSQVIGSNILFFCFVGVACAGLYFGWRYLDQHRQVMKEAKAKADAAAASRAVVAKQAADKSGSNSVAPANAAVVNQSAVAQNSAPANANDFVPVPSASATESEQAPALAAVAAHAPQAPLPSPSESQTAGLTSPAEPKVETHSAIALAPEQPAPVRLSDAIASVFTPSAKAMTVQPAVPPLPPMHHRSTSASGKSKVTAPAKPLTPEEQRLKIAQTGLEEVMAFAKNNRDTYGFRVSENLEEVKLGDPIPVFQMTQPSRTSYQGQPIKSLLKPAEEWFFPIVLQERIRYFVLVQRSGQNFVLGHGSRALAMAYEKIQSRWPASEGYHPQLVILPNTPFYYFNIPELPFENITDTSRMLDSNPEVSPASVQLGSWR